MKAGFNRWWLLPLGILTASALLASSIIVFEPSFVNRSFATVAPRGATVDCSGAKVSDYACYQERYQDLVRGSGVKAAFDDLKNEYSKNEFVQTNCHQLTHVVGRAAFSLYGDIPNTYGQGDDFCQGGYFHGAIEAVAAKIGPDKIVDEASTICADLRESQEHSSYHFSCVHGLGHGLMSILGNEVFKSLETCDTLTDTWEQESCYGGVFMENVMAASNPSHPSKYLKADQPLYPCTDIESRYKTECYKRQIWYALYTQDNDFGKVFDLCSTTKTDSRSTCYQSLGGEASWRSVNDVDQTKSTCVLGGDYEARSNCVIGVVKGFFSYYDGDQAKTQATEFCESLDTNLRDVCTQTSEESAKTFGVDQGNSILDFGALR